MVHRAVAAFAAVAVAVQLAAAVVAFRPWMTGDSERYLALAASLETGQGYGMDGPGGWEPEGWRQPGYPAFVAACHRLLGPGVAPVLVAQCVLYAASVALAWRAAHAAFGDRAATLFLVACAAYPFVAAYSALIAVEVPCAFLVALALALLPGLRPWRLADSGIALGVAGLMRPNLLPLAGVLALAVLLADRRSWRGAAALLAAAALAVAPWAVRNYVVFGVPTPGPTVGGSGVVLWVSSCEAVIPKADLVAHGPLGGPNPSPEVARVAGQARELGRRFGIPPGALWFTLEMFPGNRAKAEADRKMRGYALANIRAWPRAYLSAAAIRTARMWSTGAIPLRRFRGWVGLPLAVEGVLAFVFGVAGAALAVARLPADPGGRAIAYAVVLSLGFCCATLCWFHTEARYTIPVRLFLLALAAHAVDRFWIAAARGQSAAVGGRAPARE
jgi:hypothetical protein